MQAKYGTDVLLAANLDLAQPAKSLAPTKHLLDPSAGMDRLGVAHVGRDTDPLHFGDKAFGVLKECPLQ